MMKMLTRALLAAATFAAVFGASASAEASYRRTHITKQHFGRYLAWRHLHYRHQRYRPMFVARKQPRFMQPWRTDCLYSAGHQTRCYTHQGEHTRHVPIVTPTKVAYDSGQILPHPSGCPAVLFCGCGASIEAFGRSIRDLWAVANWFRFPRAEPARGMAVIWPGRHVAMIREYLGKGVALLYDANSGRGLTRLHRVNIAGLVVVNPHAGEKRPALVSFAGAVPL